MSYYLERTPFDDICDYWADRMEKFRLEHPELYLTHTEETNDDTDNN